MLRRFFLPRSFIIKPILPLQRFISFRTFAISADDLFGEMEKEESLVNLHHAKKQEENNIVEPSQHQASSFLDSSSVAPKQIDVFQRSVHQLSDKIEKLTALTADRREKGITSSKLEKQFGQGSSREWLQHSFSSQQQTPSTSDEFSKLSLPQTFEDKKKSLEEFLASHQGLSEQELDFVFSTSMNAVLLHSRSPAEARQALDFVKLFSIKINETKKNNNNKITSIHPFVWMSATQAGALALSTPELFSRLLNEALQQIDTYLSKISKNISFEFEGQIFAEQLSSFYTSSLSWAASQYHIEISLQVWSHFLKTSSFMFSSVKSSARGNLLVKYAALVIRSTKDLVASANEQANILGNSASNDLENDTQLDFALNGNAASKFDGGIRNRMYKLLSSKNALNEETIKKVSWENFEAILSCFDSETQVKLMKVRMMAKQQESKKNNIVMLFELLKRLIAAADVSGAEEISKIILESNEINIRIIQENAITLMLRLYCEILNPKDFDSALDLFTRYCRSEEKNEDLPKFSPNADHYTILIKGCESSDVASSLYLDACSAGVVLDSKSYRYLFQRESNTTLEKLRKLLPQPLEEAKPDDVDKLEKQHDAMFQVLQNGAVPQLPLGADAHALRLKELRGKDNKNSPIPLS